MAAGRPSPEVLVGAVATAVALGLLALAARAPRPGPDAAATGRWRPTGGDLTPFRPGT